MSANVLGRYRELVGLGEIESDPAQLGAAERLDALAQALRVWRPVRSSFMSLFGKAKSEPPRGLYIHGAVGRGKTMLMDLFHETVAYQPRQRSHFHEFMAEVHERLGQARRTLEGDPIPVVAGEIATKTRLLCFDELHVTDIADAMILGRLFKHLFERGIVVVATSNASPGELYKNGLNRQLFLPFIDLIEDHMDVIELKAAKDFRLEKLAGRPLYFTPDDAAARGDGRRALRIRRPVRKTARSARLPAHRARLSHAADRRDPGARAGAARHCSPLRHVDRHALRQSGGPDRFGGGRARAALCQRRRRRPLPAHGLAAHGDA